MRICCASLALRNWLGIVYRLWFWRDNAMRWQIDIVIEVGLSWMLNQPTTLNARPCARFCLPVPARACVLTEQMPNVREMWKWKRKRKDECCACRKIKKNKFSTSNYNAQSSKDLKGEKPFRKPQCSFIVANCKRRTFISALSININPLDIFKILKLKTAFVPYDYCVF